MVQTESAASSVRDHRGNIAVAGGGESACVISQHNNHRWRLFQVSMGERMEGRRLLGVMPLNSLQLHTVPPGILTPGTTNDFISISAISCFHQDNQYGSSSQSTSCYNVIKPMNHLIAAGTGGESLACVCWRLDVTTACFICARLNARG